MSDHNDEQYDPSQKQTVPWTRRKFLAMSGLLATGLAAAPVLKGWDGANSAAMPTARGTTTATVGRNKAAMRRLLEAFNTGDTSIVDELVRSNVRSSASRLLKPSMRTMTVRECVKHDIVVTRQTFPDLHLEEVKMIGEGDRVVLRWKMTGTHLGPLFDKPPTGKRVTLIGHEYARFEDGLIVEHTNDHENALLVALGQVGLLDQATLHKLRLV
ncbi:MAG: ester cyclase [Chloroflexia bacterium]